MPLGDHPIGRGPGCGMPLSHLHRAPIALRWRGVAGGLATRAATVDLPGDPALDLGEGRRWLAAESLPHAVSPGKVAGLEAGAHRGGQVEGEQVVPQLLGVGAHLAANGSATRICCHAR